MAIKIYEKDVKIPVIGRKNLKKGLADLIKMNEKEVGEINFIFINDEELLKINIEFLQHDFFTDVITFDYGKDEQVNGEIYMSIERIRENATKNNVSVQEEIYRVAAHGLLHLLGFKDGSSEEKIEMREQEDNFLKRMNI